MLKTMRSWKVLASVLAAAMIVGFGSVKANAIDLGGVLKVGGIAFLVDRFGGQLDNFINGLTGNKDLGHDQATKVVPIISLGSGGYIGAAQVSGTQENIDRVRAVGQIEANFSGRTFRVKALVPIDTIGITNVSRVRGVGVSAVIDVRI